MQRLAHEILGYLPEDGELIPFWQDDLRTDLLDAVDIDFDLHKACDPLDDPGHLLRPRRADRVERGLPLLISEARVCAGLQEEFYDDRLTEEGRPMQRA